MSRRVKVASGMPRGSWQYMSDEKRHVKPGARLGPVRVAAVEDDLPTLEWIERALRRDARLQWMGGWLSGEEALTALREMAVDVLLMDLGLPGISGAECCRQAVQISPRTRVLALTGQEEEKSIRGAFQAGITGYLLKPVPMVKLRQAIVECANGERLFSPKVLVVVVNGFAGREEGNAQRHGLTPRECEVLRAMARDLGNKGIADALPNDDRRRVVLLDAAAHHLRAGLEHVQSGDYMGEHWLATFAVYALTTFN